MPPRKAAAAKAAAAPAAPLGTTSPEAIARGGNPAAALFAAAAGAAGVQPGARAPGVVGATTFSPQVPKSQPIRVEIRIDGRVRFANFVYDPTFDITDEQIVLTADCNPTWIEPPKLNPPTRFVEREDARNGEEIIQRVHSGRRDIIEEEPEGSE